MASFRNPIHGNYRGYYSKRPYATDARLALLPTYLFKNATVLDIGCNEGWVTCEIAQAWGAQRVVGVDIDETLVNGAWRRRRSVWNQQAPSIVDCGLDSINSNGFDARPNKKRRHETSDTAEKTQAQKLHYFPASCEHMFGPLPVPASTPETQAKFPHNVVFRVSDWVTDGAPDDGDGYDVILAFSISKWIHLNGGDAALKRFFERVHSVLRSGGTFVLEPQAWDTYGKAKRMDERLKAIGKGLTIRPNDFPQILEGMGFEPPQHLGSTGEGGFHRPIDLYRKK